MLKRALRPLLFLFFALLAVASYAGTLTVTSPTNGAFLGTSNQMTFNITGASVQVTVQMLVTYPGGGTSTTSQQFTPDVNGHISGSMPLNFSTSSPQGAYTITVSATEPNNTYTPTTLNVTVDTIAPKFVDFSPGDGAFVKGTVHIRASIQSANMKSWKVEVGGQSIPNGTGTGNTVAVDWDTSGIQLDGAQSIVITATDLANNTSTQSINVTLDRVSPTINVVYPTSTSHIVPGSTITVLVDIQDETSNAVDKTGVDVIARRMDGTYITRVALVSFKSTGSSTNRWTGRIRYRRGLLPSKFEIVATATNKAGTSGTPQTVSVTIGP